jgi:hypothetical protein
VNVYDGAVVNPRALDIPAVEICPVVNPPSIITEPDVIRLAVVLTRCNV